MAACAAYRREEAVMASAAELTELGGCALEDGGRPLTSSSARQLGSTPPPVALILRCIAMMLASVHTDCNGEKAYSRHPLPR